ncbi:MAG: hypothetical protein WAO78_17020, partial [Roseovarius sp.]
ARAWVDGSWQASLIHTPKRRLGQTAEIEHMTIENTPMTPDKSEAEKFLAALDPSAQQFTFQTFDDNYDRRDKSLARVFNGTLDQYFDTLAAYSARGAGIFVTMN